MQDIDKEFTVTVRYNKLALWIEFIGSLVSTYVVSMAAVNGAGLSASTVAYGLSLGLLYLVGREYSGAHFNPAVTVGMALNKSVSWLVVPMYVVVQLLGAFLGATLQWYTVSDRVRTSLPLICNGSLEHFGFLRLLGIQTFAGTLIILAYLSAADLPAQKIEHGPLLVAGANICASLTALYFNGGFPNIAKVFGQALFHDRLTDPRAWVFYLGPLLGSLLGVFLHRYLIKNESIVEEVFKPLTSYVNKKIEDSPKAGAN